MKKVCVIKADERMRALACELSRRGVAVCDMQDNSGYDVLLLPYLSFKEATPIGVQTVEDIFTGLNPHGMIMAGKYPKEFADECFKRRVGLVDWFGDEELTRKNAYLTAEGALGIAVANTPRAIKNSLVTVIGYGRVAKACVSVFSRLGAHISVMARSYSARMDAYTLGCKEFDINNNAPLQDVDVIINTVPSMILDSARLEYIKKDALLIELASAPYGIDMPAARELGLKCILASGLPAKTAPATAGEYMADMVIKYLGGIQNE